MRFVNPIQELKGTPVVVQSGRLSWEKAGVR